MKTFKRWIIFVLVVLLGIPLLVLPVSAVAPGTPLGWVLYSDVVAYIDQYPIRSYNIGGNTYIVAEDLSAYGFNVEWRGAEGTLIIHTQRTSDSTGYTTTYKPEKNIIPAGTPAFQYLHTNIVTRIGNKQITGYNIGGSTCISFDDLAEAFKTDYVWDASTCSLHLTTAAYDKDANVAYDKNGIKITYKSYEISKSGELSINLQIENNTDHIVTVDDHQTSVNGYMVTGWLWEDIAIGKKLNDALTVSASELKKNDIYSIDEIELIIRIFDRNDYSFEIITDSIVITPRGVKKHTTPEKADGTAPAEQIKTFLTHLNQGVNNHTYGIQCLTNYLRTNNKSYLAQFAGYVSSAYTSIEAAYNISLLYTDMQDLLTDLKKSMDVLTKMQNGSYSMLEYGNMIEESVEYLNNVLILCKAKAGIA